MRRPPLDLSIYLVTNTVMCGELGVAATVSAAVGAGVTVVQLRDEDARTTLLRAPHTLQPRSARPSIARMVKRAALVPA
jgi:thiamine monophosphate synthase